MNEPSVADPAEPGSTEIDLTEPDLAAGDPTEIDLTGIDPAEDDEDLPERRETYETESGPIEIDAAVWASRAKLPPGTARPVTMHGTPVLHRPCRPITEFGSELRQLVSDMFESMAESEGVGLAANQIGVDARVFVYDCPDGEGIWRVAA